MAKRRPKTIRSQLGSATATACVMLAAIKYLMAKRRPKTIRSQLGSATATACVMLAAIKYLMAKRRPKTIRTYPKAKQHKVVAVNEQSLHNVQRQAAIAWGKVTDHTGSVVAVPNEEFDLNKTIFKAVSGGLARMMLTTKIGNKLYWSDEAVVTIAEAYSMIPPAPKADEAIINFMIEDCDFSMEHADGSFMDHLNFCHDYCATYFKEHSPRVLFLHSIMGVGTNCFPMGKDKVPKLKTMLDDFEFKHIEAFPSVLRLLIDQALLNELASNIERIKMDKLEKISFHRVLDNSDLTLSGKDLLIQLNYQVVHLIDFLPASCWANQINDPLFRTFAELITMLQQAEQLKAHINYEHPSGEKLTEGQPLTLGTCIMACLNTALPSNTLRKIQRKNIRKFSADIGHSLDYTIQWRR